MNPLKSARPIILAAALLAVVAGPGASAPQENQVSGVSVQGVGRYAKVVIESARPLKFREVVQKDGLGLILYLLEPAVCNRPAIEKSFHELVAEIRYGYPGGAAPTPGGKPKPIEFVNLRFASPAVGTVAQAQGLVTVDVRPAPGPTDAGGDPGLTGSGASGAGPSALPPKPYLADFVRVGLDNHQPLAIAQREHDLAHVRYLEALRNLLPAATARYTRSDGVLLYDVQVSTDDTAFKRREYGIEFGVPIFHSGANYSLYRQSSFEKRAAEARVQKTRAEVVFEITKAYYNLIKTQRSLEVRREVSRRATKIIEVARKKRQIGVITTADALGAESLFSQAHYKLLSDEKDLEIARLKLAALLNIDQELPTLIPDPQDVVDPKRLVDLSVPPESLVQTAYEQRPDMRAAEAQARAQAFAQRAAQARNLLRLDGTYFEGKAAGAFESDPLEYRRSWNAGLQASLYFLGSTAKGSATTEETVPDFAETTAQDVRGQVWSMGLFDSLRQSGDARQARINRDRAWHERTQTRRNVEVEVREAYYNVQKGKIQIAGGKTEFAYRERELEIAREKERMNLIEPQQTIAAENSYADAASAYQEALSFYQVSLAGLERAVGVPLDSIPEFR